MNIQVTITAILDDEMWGFSDLLNGRELNAETLKEIRELINEDPFEILDGTWEIKESL